MLAPLETYLPPIVRQVEEIQQVTGAEDEALVELQEHIEALQNDMYLQSLTLNGILRWEKLLDIAPSGTLDDRRKAVIIRLNEMLPYTIRRLRQMLASICGDDGYSVAVDGYTLTVRLPALSYHVAWAVYDTLARVVPANMRNIIRLVFQSPAPVGISTISKLGVTLHLYPWQVHQYKSVSAVQTAAAVKSCLSVTVLERS